MSLNAKLGVGSKFLWNTIKVNDVKSIAGIPLDNPEVDVTDLDSLAKEYIAGLKDYGTFDIEGHYVPSDAGQTALLADAQTGVVRTCSVELSTLGVTYTFNAFIKTFTFGEATPEDPIRFTATIRITGDVSVTKADLTNLVMVDGGTLTPAFDPEVYEYASITTDESLTLTPTLVGGVIKITANGATQTVSSGAASTAIPTPIGVTNILVSASKNGGTSNYKIAVARAV